MDGDALSISSDERRLLHEPYNPIYNPWPTKPVLVHQYGKHSIRHALAKGV